MSSKFVRPSKYRHLYGQPWKRDCCYEGLKISNDSNDVQLCRGNGHWISVHWESGAGAGGGAFAVIPQGRTGRQPAEQMALLEGHTACVLSTDWSPFHGNVVASGSEDTRIAIWLLPPSESEKASSDGLKGLQPRTVLSGHERRVISHSPYRW